MPENNGQSELGKFVALSLGATQAFGERFTIYLPNMGRAENDNEKQIEIPNWEDYVIQALDVLAKINGGATATAAANALYIDKDRNNEEVWENTILVYSFIEKRDQFRAKIAQVRKLAHKFGRETRQGAVFFEFDGLAYQIKPPFDPA